MNKYAEMDAFFLAFMHILCYSESCSKDVSVFIPRRSPPYSAVLFFTAGKPRRLTHPIRGAACGRRGTVPESGSKEEKTMKKLFSALLALTMSTALFTGCNQKTAIAAADVTSPEALDGLRIGVQADTTGETYVRQNLTKATVSAFKSGMDAALDLKNGNIDAIVLDELPAEAIVAQNSDLTIVDLGLEPEEYAIAVKKGNTELVEQINATIARMKEDGGYKDLTDAFMPADGNIVVPEKKAAEGSGKLIMGTNAAFPPFEYLNGTEIVGFDVSLSQEIAADQGKQLEVSNMDFEALIPALTSGQIDFIAAGMSITPERLENVDFSDTYYSSKQVVIVKK